MTAAGHVTPGVDAAHPSKVFLGATAAITVAAAALAFHRLGHANLRYDEGISWYVTRLPTGRFATALWSDEANLALHYVVERAFTAAGDSEAALRLPSVLAAVATVPVVAAIGRRLGGDLLGLVAAVAIACNALFVEYAQVARGYSLGALLVALLVYVLVRTRSDDRVGWWIAYAVIGALAMYDHFFAAFVLGALGVAALTHPAGRPARRRWLVASGATAIACLPLLHPILLRHGQGPGAVPLSVKRLGEVASAFVGGGGAALLAVAVVLCALAVVDGVRRARADPSSRVDALWPLALTAVPVGVFSAVVVAVSVRQSFLELRYWLLVSPMLALLEAQGIAALRRLKPVLIVALCALVALSGLGVKRYYDRSGDDEQWAALAAEVASAARPGDAIVVFTPERAILYGYYAPPAGPPVVYPPAGFDQLPLWDVDRWPPVSSVLDAAKGASTLWVVGAARKPADADLWKAASTALTPGYQRTWTEAHGLLLLERWDRTT